MRSGRICANKKRTEYYPAQPNITPLASVFADAEKERLELSADHANHRTTRSKYLEDGMTDEQLAPNVSQTEDWAQVKQDPMFTRFAETCDFVPLKEIRASRNRSAKAQPQIENDGTEVDGSLGPKIDMPPRADTSGDIDMVVDDSHVEETNPEDGDQAMDIGSDSGDEVPEKEVLEGNVTLVNTDLKSLQLTKPASNNEVKKSTEPVSYTHLTLPTKRIV